MNLPSWTYLVVFIGGGLLVWYIMRGCQDTPSDHSGDMHTIDSLVQLNDKNVSYTKHFKDSTQTVIIGLQNDKDSLIAIVTSDKVDIHKKGEDIQGLVDDLNAAEAAKDTVKSLSACDSLKNQFTSAKGLIRSYINANDSLQKLNDQIIASKTEIINRLDTQLTQTNQSFFATQLTLQKVDADYNTLKAKSNKHFKIGPSVGYYVTPKGSGPGIGMSFTYTF